MTITRREYPPRLNPQRAAYMPAPPSRVASRPDREPVDESVDQPDDIEPNDEFEPDEGIGPDDAPEQPLTKPPAPIASAASVAPAASPAAPAPLAPTVLPAAATVTGLDLLTSREEAALLRVSLQRLEAWRRKGIGPAFIKINARTIHYRASDIAAFLAARLQPGAAV